MLSLSLPLARDRLAGNGIPPLSFTEKNEDEDRWTREEATMLSLSLPLARDKLTGNGIPPHRLLRRMKTKIDGQRESLRVH
ncbi:hypothetical protein CEXT_329711 [Caerostris extrusa]|uniref:Uncharacterized protein n=1 Tax=Caerostris extrusa TaxID=172846 RepID=A0AAV4T680_CAEEX|nr:hypothetical protein CEXT_329711 [Caerostris extrusa]